MINQISRFQKTLLIACCSLAALAPVAKAEFNPPFAPGETLVYELRWGVISVGTGRLTVHPMKEFRGEPVWHFSLNVRTNRFADTFYRVRSRFESYVAEDFSHAVHFIKEQREGRSNRSQRVDFDPEAGTARLIDRGEEKEAIEVPFPVFDPVGLLYYFRLFTLAPDVIYPLPLSDGEEFLELRVGIIKRENVRVPAGRFAAFLLQPDTKGLRGVFEKSDDSSIRIWFSTDGRNIPVRVAGKVAVGHFWANLEAIEQTDADQLPFEDDEEEEEEEEEKPQE